MESTLSSQEISFLLLKPLLQVNLRSYYHLLNHVSVNPIIKQLVQSLDDDAKEHFVPQPQVHHYLQPLVSHGERDSTLHLHSPPSTHSSTHLLPLTLAIQPQEPLTRLQTLLIPFVCSIQTNLTEVHLFPLNLIMEEHVEMPSKKYAKLLGLALTTHFHQPLAHLLPHNSTCFQLLVLVP